MKQQSFSLEEGEQVSFVLRTPYEIIYMANILYQKHFLPGYKSPCTCMNNSDGSADIAGIFQQGVILHAYN